MSKLTNWRIEFDAPLGGRRMKRFYGATTHSGDFWWDAGRRKWCRIGDGSGRGVSSHAYPVRSFKAFLRHLRNNPILAEAGEVILESRFVGCDVRAFPVTLAGRAALANGEGK